MKTFLFFNFYKDDVITNLADTVPGNNVFIFASEKTAEFTGTWNNQGMNASVWHSQIPGQWDNRGFCRYRY